MIQQFRQLRLVHLFISEKLGYRKRGKDEIRTSSSVAHDEASGEGVWTAASGGDEPQAEFVALGNHLDALPEPSQLLHDQASWFHHLDVVQIIVAKSQDVEREGDLHLPGECHSPQAILAGSVRLQSNSVKEIPSLDGTVSNIDCVHSCIRASSCT